MGHYLYLLATAKIPVDAVQIIRLHGLRQYCTIGTLPINESLWTRLKRKLMPVAPARKQKKGP